MDEASDRRGVLRRRVARRSILRAGAAVAGTAAALGVLGCGTSKGEAPAAPPTSAPSANREWDALVAAAQAEGKLVISGSPNADTRTAIPQAFKDRFGITMEYLAGASSDLAARLQSERAAGQYTIDACIGGANTMYGTFVANEWMQPFRQQLILPEVTDDRNWRSGKLWFMDPDGDKVMRVLNYVDRPVTLNTRLVPRDQVQTIEALLDPKFKGNLGAYDPTVNGQGLPAAAIIYRAKGEDFWLRLYKGQGVSLSRDARQLADDIAREKYTATIGVGWAYVFELTKDGFQLEDLDFPDVPTPVAAGFGLVGMFRDAPHPKAAQLFVNWIASKDGATVMARAEKSVSNRVDVPPVDVPDTEIPQPGVEYFDRYGWDYVTQQENVLRVRFQELLKG
jgi:iron(III) transport system substrate-binding protein